MPLEIDFNIYFSKFSFYPSPNYHPRLADASLSSHPTSVDLYDKVVWFLVSFAPHLQSDAFQQWSKNKWMELILVQLQAEFVNLLYSFLIIIVIAMYSFTCK